MAIAKRQKCYQCTIRYTRQGVCIVCQQRNEEERAAAKARMEATIEERRQRGLRLLGRVGDEPKNVKP